MKISNIYIEYCNKNRQCFACRGPFEPKDEMQFLCSDSDCTEWYNESKENVIEGFMSRGLTKEQIALEITEEIIMDRIREIIAKTK